jgi:hypothetical protein
MRIERSVVQPAAYTGVVVVVARREGIMWPKQQKKKENHHTTSRVAMGLIVDWLIDDDKDGEGAATGTKPRGRGGCYPSSNWRPAAPAWVPQLAACTKQHGQEVGCG